MRRAAYQPVLAHVLRGVSRGLPGVTPARQGGAMSIPPEGAPERFFTLADRPVMQWRLPDGGQAVLAMHPSSGAFLPSHTLHTRLREGAADLDELDRPAFLEAVRSWRARAAAARHALPIQWQPTTDVEYPYRAEQDGQELVIRANFHLPDPPWSVLVAGQVVEELWEWPAAWVRV
jgi:hypothetical protein